MEEIFGGISANLLEGRFSRTVPEFQVAATVAAYAGVLRDSRQVAVDLGGVLDEALALRREIEDSTVDEFIRLVQSAVTLAR